jgi:sugar phosphate isomerase/epimerase
MTISVSASTGILAARGIEESARTLARLGFDGMEIWASLSMPPDKHDHVSRMRLRNLCSELGLKIVGTHGVLPPTGYRFTCDDPQERQRGIDYMRAVIDMTAELGGIVVTVGAPGARNRPAGVTEATAWTRLREAFATWADHAATLGVRVSIEIVNRYEADMFRTIAEGLRMVRELERPNLGITPDTFHMNIDEGPFTEAIMCGGRHIMHMHAGDNNRQAPGEGNLDFRAIARALKAINYHGFWSLELFEHYHGIPLCHKTDEALAIGLAHLREVIGDVYG